LEIPFCFKLDHLKFNWVCLSQ